ncbi:spore germination protein YaaH [Streptomyces azureus]|uniref:Spore germination protein YaaH n=1 Tax=Streptomyces azureus TaxID=146537 RepID=A0A0K8PHF9_STRAJ|nr:spore germination protein YaaH [Streptomyces azureus]
MVDGRISRSPCTTTHPLAVNDKAVTEAAMRALRADLRSVRGSRSLLIGFLHLPLSGGEPYRVPPAVGPGVCLREAGPWHLLAVAGRGLAGVSVHPRHVLPLVVCQLDPAGLSVA